MKLTSSVLTWEHPMTEIITVIAQISALTFILTSMLAMGLSLTVKQIMNPLRNSRLTLLTLLPKVTTTEGPRVPSNDRILAI